MKAFAGALFFLAGSILLLGILTAEIFYPGRYSISQNMISNLGSTPPPQSIIRQPSADIFDYSLIVTGIVLAVGAGMLYISIGKKLVIPAIFLLGLGTFLVGIFPAFHRYAHPLSALLAFVAGGIAALSSIQITKYPFILFAGILGVISITFLCLGLFFPQSVVPLLGKGGVERWVLYPITLWLVGFGGYYMGSTTKK